MKYWTSSGARMTALALAGSILAACGTGSSGSPAPTSSGGAPTTAPVASAAPASPAAAPSAAIPAPSSAPSASPAPVLSPAAAPASGQQVVVPAILPLTGPAAFLGQPEQQALQILESTTNAQGGIQGRPIHFDISDDQTDPTTAVQLTSRIVSQNVPLLLGSSLVASCQAMAPLVLTGPVTYCLSPGIHPDAGTYVYSSDVSTADLAESLIEYYHAQGWDRIAVITSSDATGQDAVTGIQAAVAQPRNSGVQLVTMETFNTTDVSVDAQVSRMKAQNPQAVIAWSTGAPIATVFQALQTGGLDVPVATTSGNMTYAQMTQYASFLPSRLFLPTSEWAMAAQGPPGPVHDAQQVFQSAMQAANVKPDIGSILGWDPGLLLVSALRQLGPNATAQQVRDYINSQTAFAGISGEHNYQATPQRGLDLSDAIVTTWDPSRGTWVPVTTPGS